MVEKPRIRQSRADHPLVAGDDGLAAVFGFEIGNEEKLVDELGGRGVAQHEAFLVVADRGADDFFRNLQERLVECAHEHHRPFDETGGLRKKPLVHHEFEALCEGELLRLGVDDAAPALGVEHHLGLVELGGVVRKPAHGKTFRRQEAMAAGDIAGGDAVDRERHDVGVLGFRTERGEDRMQRPHPSQRAGIFGLHAPAHRLRPGETLDHRGEDFADDVERRPAWLLDHRNVEIAFFVRLHFCLGERFQAGGFEKTGDGLLRRADARAFFLLAPVRLAHRHALHRERQPPRRHERLGAVVDEPGFDQPVGDRFAQIVRSPRLHARGNFLRE